MTEVSEPLHLTNWRFEIDIEGIGWLTVDSQGGPVNTLGTTALAELESLVTRIETAGAAGTLRGVVLQSGKTGGFIAGADIAEFDGMSDAVVLGEALRRTHALFDRIEALKVPMVATIHGYCLGGGLELALCCAYRIAVDDDATRLGFPEVNIGIFPGFGGTGRSIRQMGPVAAMRLMLSGRPLKARAARGAGLVDKLVRHRDMLRWEARRAVLAGRRSRPAGWEKQLAGLGLVRPALARRMRAEVARKAPPDHYPAPDALIALFEQHGGDWRAMVNGEADRFVPLMGSPTAANLRRVFFLSESLKKQGLRGRDTPRFRRVHVIGAGVMGGDIAAWCALRGLGVTLEDVDAARLAPALGRAKALFRKRLKSRAEVDAALARLEADPEGRGVPRADVIIEAVVEKIEVKRAIFSALEARAKPDVILASNTSALALEEIAVGMQSPARLLGLHFFNPVPALPLVEVVRSAHNSDTDIARAASFALAIGKSPLVVRSAPGFLVNRVLMPYLRGAVERVEQGASAEQLDAAAVRFGMPMGPIELLDTVGLDIGAAVARELGHPMPQSGRFASLLATGKLGRKAGEGFYRWERGEPVKADPAPHADLAGLGRDLVRPLVEEAGRVVAEDVVATADLADIGIILGTGFAPFLGGPLKARRDGRV